MKPSTGMIRRYRRLREWITDRQARRALRELIMSEEAKLAEEKKEQGDDE